VRAGTLGAAICRDGGSAVRGAVPTGACVAGVGAMRPGEAGLAVTAEGEPVPPESADAAGATTVAVGGGGATLGAGAP
jgi:hypothetical protein